MCYCWAKWTFSDVVENWCKSVKTAIIDGCFLSPQVVLITKWFTDLDSAYETTYNWVVFRKKIFLQKTTLGRSTDEILEKSLEGDPRVDFWKNFFFLKTTQLYVVLYADSKSVNHFVIRITGDDRSTDKKWQF